MRKILALVLLLFSATFFIYKPAPGFASSFASAYVRLNSQQASVPLSGTICAQASSAGAGIENSVTVTFPSDFTISQTASDWTTSVTNLPSGSATWPVIGSPATSISGQSVTFSSSDLTLNTLYCFNFTGASSTTGAVGDNKTGTITTKDNLNSTIDLATYAVSIVDNNQISVTATIDPHVSDLPIALQSLTAGTQFPENTTISYQITYGSTSVGPIPLTIQAQWSQGTVQGSPTPSVDILNYVVGSANNAYNSTAPVIDTVNRTITWTITSFPGNTTNKTVNFSLKTNSSYTGSNNVSFDISAQAISGSTVTPDQTITQNYLYSASSTPTSTSTSTSSSPTPAATTTPTTPTVPTPINLSFSDISIHSVSQSNASIAVTTNHKAMLTISYGTSLNSLLHTIKTLTSQTQNIISLPNLLPNTTYYFKITAKDANGITVTSDIFTFTTAIVSTTPEVNQQTLTVTSSKNILINPAISSALNELQKNIIVIPQQSIFEIQFALNKPTLIKSIQAIIRNKNVLGFSTIASQADAASNYVNLVETQPGVYTGKIAADYAPGLFEIYVRIVDFNGNISEQKIADLRITTKFRMFKKGTTNVPVENARVLLFLYNEESRIYAEISPEVLTIQNPIYSLPDGSLDLVLPYGKYKAEISGIGFYPETVEFEINPNFGGYPTVYLTQQPFNIVNTIKYYGTTFLDAITASEASTRFYANSNRLFDLLALSGMILFIFSAFVSFSARTHIPLFYIPYFFIYKLKIIFLKNKTSLIFGNIISNENKEKVSKANVYLIDAATNTVISHTKTNKLGEFYFNKGQTEIYKIMVMKKGFVSSPFYEYTKETINAMPIMISIKKDIARIATMKEILFIYIEDIFGVMLESLLIMAMILEIYFIFTFGFLKIAPFLFLSAANIILLLLFLYKPRKLSA